MKVYIQVDEDNKIVSYNLMYNPMSDDIEIDVDEVKNLLGSYYIEGEVIQDNEGTLKRVKINKQDEIDKACNEAILAGFFHEIGGEKYRFSYDLEAQMNFERLSKMFEQGIIDEQMKTARNESGEHVRVSINKEIMREIYIISQKHVNDKVAKFRDYYVPMINEAKTIEEVQSIQWEHEDEVLSKEELKEEMERFYGRPTVEQLQAENENLRAAILELSDILLEGF